MSYYPEPAPQDVNQLGAWLESELRRIGDALANVHNHTILYAEPERLFEGMRVYADGTTWNPGSGKGAYEYDGSAWVKL